jgi:hypothetical protein
MRKYHWKFVLARDLMALLAALLWAGRSYTSTYLEKTCNPDWLGFSLYAAAIVSPLLVIELLCWVLWQAPRLFQNTLNSVKPVETEARSVSVKSPTSKFFLSTFIPGVILNRDFQRSRRPNSLRNTHGKHFHRAMPHN